MRTPCKIHELLLNPLGEYVTTAEVPGFSARGIDAASAAKCLAELLEGHARTIREWVAGGMQ